MLDRADVIERHHGSPCFSERHRHRLRILHQQLNQEAEQIVSAWRDTSQEPSTGLREVLFDAALTLAPEAFKAHGKVI
jgi:hypothetical protein